MQFHPTTIQVGTPPRQPRQPRSQRETLVLRTPEAMKTSDVFAALRMKQFSRGKRIKNAYCFHLFSIEGLSLHSFTVRQRCKVHLAAELFNMMDIQELRQVLTRRH